MTEYKVLLINPPQFFKPYMSNARSGLPIGLLYIAAMLDREGHEVEVLDTLVTEEKDRAVGNIRYTGMSWETIKRRIKASRADVIGVTCPSTVQAPNAIEIGRIVREIDRDVPLIIGGPHATVKPEDFLETYFDIAVMGEGEYTILEVMEYLEKASPKLSQIKGIAFKESNGDIKVNQPREFIRELDSLPYPAYHLVDMLDYTLPPHRSHHHSSKLFGSIPMITSRGCPFSCVFCSIHLHMGRIWRPHSPEYVLDHIEHLITKYNVRAINFEDDNLTLDPKRFEAILDGIIERDLHFYWDTPNGVRADTLNRRILEKMKKAGCVELRVSPESGVQRVIDKVIKKKLKLESVTRVAKICHELGIQLQAFFVVGLPGETLEDIRATFEYAKMLKTKYGVIPSPCFATPLIGTELYRICKEKGYLMVEDITPETIAGAGQKGIIRTEEFSPEDIKRIVREVGLYRSDYLL